MGKQQSLATQFDLQFGRAYDQTKANQLVQNLQSLGALVQALMQQVAVLQAASGGTTVAPHVLATNAGLDPDHTVSGLTAGTVLRASGANDAAFARLALEDIEGFSITALENDQILQFVNGYWENVPISSLPSTASGKNLGTGLGVYAGLSTQVLEFRSLVPGRSIDLTENSTSIIVDLAAAEQYATDSMAFFMGT